MKTSKKILKWAKDKDLLTVENLPNILDKLYEEVGELADAIIIDKDNTLAEMELGDVQFVLTQIANLIETDLKTARKKAVKKVLKRTGKTVNGQFIKD